MIKKPEHILLFVVIISLSILNVACKKTGLFKPEIVDYPHKKAVNKLFEAADAFKYAQDYPKADSAFRALLNPSLLSTNRQYVLNQLAFVNLKMNADSVANQYIQLLENTSPPLSIEDLADLNFNRGIYACHTFQPKKAENYLKEALSDYKKIYGEQHLRTALCKTELGIVYYEFEPAVDSILNLIKEANTFFKSKDYLTPFCPLNELGMTFLNIPLRSHSGGEGHCDIAIDILNNLPFKDTVLIARCYCMKAYMIKKQGQNETDSGKAKQYFKDAEVYFNKAIELGQQVKTIRLQEFYSEATINYSWLKDDVSFFKNTEKLKQLTVNQLDRYAHVDRLLGYYYYDRNVLKCKESYLRAWKMFENDTARDAKIVIETLFALSQAYSSLGQFDSAFFYLKNYYAISTGFEAKGMKTNDLFKPSFYKKLNYPAVSFSSIGEILLKKYRKSNDLNDLKAAFEAFTLTDDLLFPGIQTADEEAVSTFQKEVANKTYTLALETAYELQNKTPKPLYLDYIFKFCERSKAFLLYRNASGGGKLTPQNQPPVSVLDSLKMLDSEVSQLSRQKDLGESNAQSLTESREQFTRLFDYVRVNFPEYYRLKTTQPMPSLQTVQTQLKEGQGLIQFHWSEQKIHILFVSKNTVIPYQVFADAAFLQQIKDYRAILTNEKKVKPLAYAKIAFGIYKKLLEPLTPQLKTIKEVVIVPDKELHQIPFESLVTSDLSADFDDNFKKLPYLIHKIQITYTPAWKIYERNSRDMLPDNPSVLSFTYGHQPKVMGYLPNSMGEIDSLMAVMKNKHNKVLRGYTCNKDNLKGLAPAFDILHFSLHAQSSLKDKFDNKIFFKIPLSDTLYSYDIAEMTFKAKLVVLSACNTATGKIESSEGSYSLTRSFLQVGVSNVIASLWKISNTQTASILPNFYRHLSAKNTPSLSLHYAKLTYLKEKSDNITAHPRYWAGLVCVD